MSLRNDHQSRGKSQKANNLKTWQVRPPTTLQVEQEGGHVRITQIKSQIPLFERILDHSKHQLLRCYTMIGWWKAKLFIVVVT